MSQTVEGLADVIAVAARLVEVLATVDDRDARVAAAADAASLLRGLCAEAAAWAAPTRPARVPPAFLPTPLPTPLPAGAHEQYAPMAALTGGPLPAVEGMDSGRVEEVIAAVAESAGHDGWAATATVRQQVGAPSDSTWHRWVTALERAAVIERGDRGRRVRRTVG